MKPSEKERLVSRYNELDVREKAGEKLGKKEKDEMRQIYFALLEVELKAFKRKKAKERVKRTGEGSNYTPPKKRRKKQR